MPPYTTAAHHLIPVNQCLKQVPALCQICKTAAYDVNEQTEIYRIDGVWAAKAIYPELGLRLWGAVVPALA